MEHLQKSIRIVSARSSYLVPGALVQTNTPEQVGLKAVRQHDTYQWDAQELQQ